jgi:cytochrome c553
MLTFLEVLMKELTILTTLILLAVFSPISQAQNAEKGKTLYASCIECHGDKGDGNAAKLAPRLSGQFDWYVLKQLTELKSGVRKIDNSSRYQALSEADMKDLAAYIITL